MNGDLYFDGKKYISSSRAAKLSGYVSDYIGQLCRDGKVDCRMVGRSWYISVDSLLLHKETNALVKAKRQKKLSKESHDNYVKFSKKTPDGTEDIYRSKKSIPLFGERISSGENEIEKRKKYEVINIEYLKDEEPLIPEIPEIPKAYPLEKPEKQDLKSKSKTSPAFLNFGLSLTSVLLIILIFMSSFSLDEKFFGSSIKDLVVNTSNIAKSSESIQENFLDRLALNTYEYVNSIVFKGGDLYKSLTTKQDPKQEVLEEETKPISEGMVIVPTSPDTSASTTVAAIKNSFSDEVTVSPEKDGSSGIIKPVFKQRNGDEYIYVLVPINN